MANGFPPKFIDELKSKNDIVGVISAKVELTKKGQNFWGCCPFHKEKTGSFSVNPIGGFYHCFGCGASGDVIKFVTEYEGMTFMEAVEWLATRVGMTVPKLDTSRSDQEILQRKSEKDGLISVMKAAMEYYNWNFFNSTDEKAVFARKYLQNRGVSLETAKKFKIGMSLSGSDLISFLSKKGFTRKQMLDSGLAAEKDGRVYDSLAGRLIIPIFNPQGVCVAFGGRVLVDTGFAKYKNTRETMLFVKNSILYGLNFAKELRGSLNDLILLEGYMDCISLAQAGIENVCASMGTSLTEQQAVLLKRFVDTVYICYDGDSAGQNATVRGMDILAEKGLTVMVMSLPDKLDPDEIVRYKGKDAFVSLKKTAMPLIDYKLLLVEREVNLATVDGKAKYAKSAVEILSKCDEAVAAVYYAFVAKKTGLDVSKITDLSKLPDLKKLEISSQNEAEREQEQLLICKNIVLYYLIYSYDYALTADYHGILNSEEIDLYEYVTTENSNGNKPLPNIVYQFLDEKRAYAILTQEVPQLSEELKKDYFVDCMYKLKLFVYKKQISELKDEYMKCENPSLKDKILEIMQKLKKPKR